MQPRIADYGIIGDGRSAALISRHGSIDWLCWPRFDSPPVLGALLDEDRGGRWQLAPVRPLYESRRYLEDTNVLETRFVTETGEVTITDVMAVASEEDKRHMLVADHEILRRVRCERGRVEMAFAIDPRQGFGARPRVQAGGVLGVRWEIESGLMTLRGDVPLVPDGDGAIRTCFSLQAGRSATFSLSYDAEGPAVIPVLGDRARQAIDRTIAWWRAWAARARYSGPYRDQVVRSALTLKLMSFAPSGAIIAAPTTSLPERIGAALNWDYRYCWLRDASFTARVLLDLGYVEDAEAFCSWLLHTTRLTRPELRVLYDVYGNDPEPEREVAAFTGYRDSRPVRAGNLAFDQLQLDTYGEVIDATAQVAFALGELDHETQHVLCELGDYICESWPRPDAGIWEPRDQLRHRTHSRLCCWVALDRLLELHARGLLTGLDAPRLAAQRAGIRANIEHHAYDRTRGCYTGELGPSDLDAAVLLMSWYGFHRADAPRMQRTYARVCERLGAAPGLFYRYEASRRHGEGAFWICSYWAVEHLVRGGGSLAEARQLFERATGYANDLGLMAEEVEPRDGEQLGNFPQAYTHVGLISAALSLEQAAAHTVAIAEPERAPAPTEIRP